MWKTVVNNRPWFIITNQYSLTVCNKCVTPCKVLLSGKSGCGVQKHSLHHVLGYFMEIPVSQKLCLCV